jgi:single-strand DNA-binding protein
MLNKVILMGRMVSDPELKTTTSNLSVASFSVAVERNYVKQGSERETDFINVVAWRQTAEFVCKYFSKGQLIALDGTLQTRSYKDRDGNNRYITEVVTDNVYFTGDRKNDNSSQQSTTKNTKQNNTRQSNNQYNNPPANNYGGYSDFRYFDYDYNSCVDEFFESFKIQNV